MKSALILIDVQKDFCPGGALPAPDGFNIIPVINQLMDQFKWVIATKDWHPKGSIHFDKWPIHCVQHTEGAEFPIELDFKKIKEIFLKGTGNLDDGYSAFDATNISLEKWLKKRQINTLYFCGIATDYCVLESAKHALRLGFKTYIITDAIAAINVQPDDGKKALENLQAQGARLISSKEVITNLEINLINGQIDQF